MKRLYFITAVTLAIYARCDTDIYVNQSDLTWVGSGTEFYSAWGAEASFDVLTDIIAWWKLDEASEAAHTLDSAGSATGTVANSASFIAGRVDNAISLNGTSQYVSTTFTQQLSDFSATAWFFSDTDATRNYDRIIDKNYISGFVLCRAGNASNKWSAYFIDEAVAHPLTVTLNDGAWHHLALVRSGTTLTLYGDGGAVSASRTVSAGAISDYPLVIGWSEPQYGYNYFKGAIDDVRIYSRALSSNEVATIYNLYK
jgi:hypothetical protein